MRIAVLVPEDRVISRLAMFAKKEFVAAGHQIVLVSHPPESLSGVFFSRLRRVGFFTVIDEMAYCLYETLFTPWLPELVGLDDGIYAEFDARIQDTQSEDLAFCLKERCVDILVAIGCRPINVRLIPSAILALNIHPGVLPYYRGVGSPEAVLRCDTAHVGCTVHRLTEQLDSGEIFLRKIGKSHSDFNAPKIYMINYQFAIKTLARHIGQSFSKSWPVDDDFSGTLTSRGGSLWRLTLSKFLGWKLSSICHRILGS